MPRPRRTRSTTQRPGEATRKRCRTRHVAVYARVSSRQQDTAAQEAEIRQWSVQRPGETIQEYHDNASGRSMDRPGWNRLWKSIEAGEVSDVVVWRLDRLGRTASGLTQLFDELQRRGVNLISLREGMDLGTPAGRLMANVLASVAQYETEVRGERQAVGIARAKAAGKRWGGSLRGRRITVTEDQVEVVRAMAAARQPVTKIARATGLSRPTVYRLMAEEVE